MNWWFPKQHSFQISFSLTWQVFLQRSYSGAMAALLIVLTSWISFWQPIEGIAYSALFQWRGPQAWDDRVVVVAIDEPSLAILGKFPWDRDYYRQLLEVLSQAQPNVVVFDLVFSEPTPQDLPLAIAMRHHRQVLLAQAWNSDGKLWRPNSVLREAAIGVGHILETPDADGLTRRFQPRIQTVPSLGIVALESYRLFEEAPVTDDLIAPLWINWRGPVAQLPQVSFVDVLRGRVETTTFHNKIVLVGVSAIGLNPIIMPFDLNPPASGVHLQATILNNLLQHNFLQRLPWLGEGILLLLFGPSWSIVIGRRSGRWQVFLTIIMSLAWCLIAVGCLRLNYWLPVATPIGLLWLTTLMTLMLRTRTLEVSNKRLGYLANVDELTQVANRRYFDQYLRQEWQRSLRDQQAISLVLCDVDFFKQFNDLYGHIAGDHCLEAVAQVLRSSVKRPSDLVARYGGEEFAIILPNTDLVGTNQLANSIVINMRSKLIPHGASPISHYITLSLGVVSTIPNLNSSLQTLIDTADQALYQAKREGRNRTCARLLVNVFSEEMPLGH